MKKNTFDNDLLQENFSKKEGESIISDRVDSVMKEKFETLLFIYQRDASENGYNPSLAFRVIALYLYTEVKIEFNLIEQSNRFVKYQLEQGTLSDIQKCLNFLMIKSVKLRIPDKLVKLWMIKLLAALRKYYSKEKEKKEKKKVSTTLRQICREQLKDEAVKHDVQNYSQVLDILIEEEYSILKGKKAKGKVFEAIENCNNIIRALEKAEQILIPKYQQKLMMGYWQLAKLHHHLHYITYAKKYASITLNIAQRINEYNVANGAQAMLDAIVVGEI